jgi:hypothetical protein
MSRDTPSISLLTLKLISREERSAASYNSEASISAVSGYRDGANSTPEWGGSSRASWPPEPAAFPDF